MLRSIRNVKLLKCVSLICLSPLFVFYSSLNYDGPRTKAFYALQSLGILCFSLDDRPGYQASFAMAAGWRPWI